MTARRATSLQLSRIRARGVAQQLGAGVLDPAPVVALHRPRTGLLALALAALGVAAVLVEHLANASGSCSGSTIVPGARQDHLLDPLGSPVATRPGGRAGP